MSHERIRDALDVAVRFGSIGGEHHKAWVIDQMVRALTGCPMVLASANDAHGSPYEYAARGESPEYSELVRAACDGDDGPGSYAWDVGIAP